MKITTSSELILLNLVLFLFVFFLYFDVHLFENTHRLRKKLHFAMPSRPLSEIQQQITELEDETPTSDEEEVLDNMTDELNENEHLNNEATNLI